MSLLWLACGMLYLSTLTLTRSFQLSRSVGRLQPRRSILPKLREKTSLVWGQDTSKCLLFTPKAALSADGHRRNPSLSTFKAAGNPETSADHKFPVKECWEATAWSVNPNDDEEINAMLRCFQSPAPPAYFALTRALKRNQTLNPMDPTKDHNECWEILQTFSVLLKRDHEFWASSYNKLSPTFLWTISSDGGSTSACGQAIDPTWTSIPPLSASCHPNTLQIAHHVLALATEESQKHRALETKELDKWARCAIERLDITLGTDIRGRSSADAAFSFALAGVSNLKLYQRLTEVAYWELRRTGERPSFPSKYVLQILEKLAAAGIRSTSSTSLPVYSLGADLLASKAKTRGDPGHSEMVAALRDSIPGSPTSFGLHSERTLNFQAKWHPSR